MKKKDTWSENKFTTYAVLVIYEGESNIKTFVLVNFKQAGSGQLCHFSEQSPLFQGMSSTLQQHLDSSPSTKFFCLLM